VGGVVLNAVQPAVITDDDLSRVLAGTAAHDGVEADLARAGVTGVALEELLREARDHAERREVEAAQRAAVAALRRPTYELARRPDGVDLAGLHALAADLRRQGMA
jgi:hypothetical protein